MKLSIYRKKMTLRHISGDGKMLEHKPLKSEDFGLNLKQLIIIRDWIFLFKVFFFKHTSFVSRVTAIVLVMFKTNNDFLIDEKKHSIVCAMAS